MREESAPAEALLARIAMRQHGVVRSDQLRAVGIDKSAISRRVAKGGLHRLHRGVYAVGHLGLSREGRWLAAVLACGDGAALSHASAAALWELLPARKGPLDVSVSARSGRKKRAGIRLHRCASLGKGTTTWRRGIPVTTPARTIADLREAVPGWQWRKAVRQAEFKKMALGSEVETDGTRSDLERDFLRLCRRHGLPAPEVNVKVGRWTVDFLWRQQRVAVETDFYYYHCGRIAFQDDHARDLDLRRHGFEVRRFSEQQVNEEEAEMMADLRQALLAGR